MWCVFIQFSIYFWLIKNVRHPLRTCMVMLVFIKLIIKSLNCVQDNIQKQGVHNLNISKVFLEFINAILIELVADDVLFAGLEPGFNLGVAAEVETGHIVCGDGGDEW